MKNLKKIYFFITITLYFGVQNTIRASVCDRINQIREVATIKKTPVSARTLLTQGDLALGNLGSDPNYGKALNFYNKAIKVAERAPNKASTSISIHGIAERAPNKASTSISIHGIEEPDIPERLKKQFSEYLKKQIPESFWIKVMAKSGIIQTKIKMGDMNQAKELLDKLYEKIKEEIKNFKKDNKDFSDEDLLKAKKIIIQSVLVKIMHLILKKKEFEKAKDLLEFLDSKKYDLEPDSIVESMYNKLFFTPKKNLLEGLIYFKQNDFKKAEEKIKSSYQTCIALGLLYEIREKIETNFRTKTEKEYLSKISEEINSGKSFHEACASLGLIDKNLSKIQSDFLKKIKNSVKLEYISNHESSFPIKRLTYTSMITCKIITSVWYLETLLKLKKFEKAESIFNDAFGDHEKELTQSIVFFIYFKGIISESKGNFQNAAGYFKLAIEKIQKYLEDRSNYSCYSIKSGKYPKSWQDNQEYLKSKHNEGVEKINEKNYKEASQIFKAALEKVGLYPTTTGQTQKY